MLNSAIVWLLFLPLSGNHHISPHVFPDEKACANALHVATSLVGTSSFTSHARCFQTAIVLNAAKP